MMLEKRLPKDSLVWRRMIDTEAECETAARALIAAGPAQESDAFIFRIIVAPREAAASR
jgi:hypothetical protein